MMIQRWKERREETILKQLQKFTRRSCRKKGSILIPINILLKVNREHVQIVD